MHKNWSSSGCPDDLDNHMLTSPLRNNRTETLQYLLAQCISVIQASLLPYVSCGQRKQTSSAHCMTRTEPPSDPVLAGWKALLLTEEDKTRADPAAQSTEAQAHAWMYFSAAVSMTMLSARSMS